MKSKLFYGILILFSLSFISCASLPSVNIGKKGNKKTSFSYKTIEISEKLDYLDTEIKYPEF